MGHECLGPRDPTLLPASQPVNATPVLGMYFSTNPFSSFFIGLDSLHPPAFFKDLTRAMQDITAVKPRLKGLPKNLPRKKEMIAKGRADEILEKTSLKGPEDMKPGQVVLKEEDESKLDSGGEEAIPRPRKGLQRMSQMEAR